MLSKFWIDIFDSLESMCFGNRLLKKRENMTVLRSHFPGQIFPISRFGDIDWPARSPDDSSLDFFFWGYLKGRVHRENPTTLDPLKETMQTEIRLISSEITSAVMKTM